MEKLPGNEPEKDPDSIPEELRAEIWAAAIVRVTETGSLCGNKETDCTIRFENLRRGDIIVMDFFGGEENKDFCYFRIDEILWDDLNITTNLPSPSITGHLIGSDAISEQHRVSTSGSSTSSGSWFRRGRIEKGLCINFFDTQTRKVHILETLLDVGIIRVTSDSNEITVSCPDDTESEEVNPEITEIYSVETTKINEIMAELGFDTDFNTHTTEQSKKYKICRKGPFFAKFTSGSSAMGNELIVFDTRSRRVTLYTHFNFEGQRMIQIAYADIPKPIHQGPSTADERMQEFERLDFSTPIHLMISHVFRTHQTIVTRTISPTSGLDVITVHPRTTKSSGHFGPPDIQIIGGEVQIMTNEYPYSTMSDNTLMELESECAVVMSKSGQPEVIIDGKVVSTDLTHVSDEILKLLRKKWWDMK